jgi:hypothetical protein
MNLENGLQKLHLGDLYEARFPMLRERVQERKHEYQSTLTAR